MPILGVIASSISGQLSNPSYDSIISYSGGSNATITFNNIPQTYKHLELRIFCRTNAAGSGGIDANMIFNNVSGNYNWREMSGQNTTTRGNSAAIATTSLSIIRNAVPRSSETGYGTSIITIPNYTGATLKSFNARAGFVNGSASVGTVSIISGSSNQTAAISRIDLTIEGGNTWTSDSWLELYGIKG